jgi:uncharacterized protein (DUF305 family)
MKTSRQILIVVSALALIEFSYVVTTHDGTPDVAPSVAELVAGGNADASFLRTMIDRQRATLALVEREARYGQRAATRKMAESMLAHRKQELDALLALERAP